MALKDWSAGGIRPQLGITVEGWGVWKTCDTNQQGAGFQYFSSWSNFSNMDARLYRCKSVASSACFLASPPKFPTQENKLKKKNKWVGYDDMEIL